MLIGNCSRGKYYVVGGFCNSHFLQIQKKLWLNDSEILYVFCIQMTTKSIRTSLKPEALFYLAGVSSILSAVNCWPNSKRKWRVGLAPLRSFQVAIIVCRMIPIRQFEGSAIFLRSESPDAVARFRV